jgi:hypothetical protein
VSGMRPWRIPVPAVLLFSAAATMLTACASTGGSGEAGSGAGAAGSCIAASPSAELARARVVFIGTALPGPMADAGSAGAVLASPARFRVARYVKGSGPSMVTVQTALTIEGNGVIANEDGIAPRAGQRWTIYTTSLRMPYHASDCTGSCVLGRSDSVNVACGASARQGVSSRRARASG